MVRRIPDEMLRMVLEECDHWSSQPTMTRGALQSLLGHLGHIVNCIPAVWSFMSRLLAGLHGLCRPCPAKVDPEICKDVQWFRAYAEPGNGVHLLPPPVRREWVIKCDSCLTGGGAFSKEHCYAEEYSLDFIRVYPLIHELKALNLVVAVRTLRPGVSTGLNLIVNKNNAAFAHTLEMGQATDATLESCARKIWLLGSFTITIRHKPGADLIFVLSCTSLEFVAKYCASHNVARVRVTHDTNDILSHSL